MMGEEFICSIDIKDLYVFEFYLIDKSLLELF